MIMNEKINNDFFIIFSFNKPSNHFSHLKNQFYIKIIICFISEYNELTLINLKYILFFMNRFEENNEDNSDESMLLRL